jgi:WD40 repeat protein
VYALAASGSGGFYSGSGDRVVAAWNLSGNGDGSLLVNAPEIVYALLPVPGENKLLVGQAAGGIHVIGLDDRKEERLLKYHDAAVFHLDVAPMHGLYFSFAGDGLLGVIQSGDWSLLQKLRLSEGKLRASALSPDQRLLAIGSADGAISVYELPSMMQLRRWQAHQPGFSVNALAFSPDGKRLLSGSRDAHLNVFDAQHDFRQIGSIPAHNYAIYSIAFSPDGSLFATGSRDKTIKIWDAEKMDVLARIDREQHGGHMNSVNKVIWLPTGEIVSGGDDRTIMIWQIGNAGTALPNTTP